MTRFAPYPETKHPLLANHEWLRSLKDIIKSKNIVVGNYSYYLYDQGDDEFEKNIFYGNNANARLIIGKFCQIFNGVKFLISNKSNINIGNDVWVGSNTTIMSGLTIGDGAIIANNSIITSNVEPYTIVAGYPATIVKYRFNNNTIQELTKINWWDWDIEKIRLNALNISIGNTEVLKN